MTDVFYVRDNGIGIDPEFHADVFKMFKRLNRPEDFGPGSGAGLAFVQKVIECNGARIVLESAPGKGSTFFFSFTEQAYDRSKASGAFRDLA